jgi:hypothetical protein
MDVRVDLKSVFMPVDQWNWLTGFAVRRSWTFQKSPVEGCEQQDDSDVGHQPLPESVPEKQNVHGVHHGYQHKHAKHEGCLSSHASVLLQPDPR